METTILKAKNNLSSLLRKAEAGEPVYIQRGRKGPRFRIVPERWSSKEARLAFECSEYPVLEGFGDLWVVLLP